MFRCMNFIVIGMLLCSCGSKDPSERTPKNQVKQTNSAEGYFGGGPWLMANGEALPGMIPNTETYVLNVTLWESPSRIPCAKTSEKPGREIRFQIPIRPDGQLGKNLYYSFEYRFDDSQGEELRLSDDGKVVVTHDPNDRLSGSIRGDGWWPNADESAGTLTDNGVDGDFSVPICP